MTNSAAMARSFSASFVFAIRSRYDGLTSYGLAFVVALTSNLSAAESGRYLGLLNATNGPVSSPILAVELDTILSPEFRDINSNHVGIDVNSLQSIAAHPAGYYDDKTGAFHDLLLISGKAMQVWVDYDSGSAQISVFLAPLKNGAKPSTPLVSAKYNLSEVLVEPAYAGFSSSTGTALLVPSTSAACRSCRSWAPSRGLRCRTSSCRSPPRRSSSAWWPW